VHSHEMGERPQGRLIFSPQLLIFSPQLGKLLSKPVALFRQLGTKPLPVFDTCVRLRVRTGRGAVGFHDCTSVCELYWSDSSTARNASCGISTCPTCFMRFLPAACLAHSLRLRVMSPP